MIAWPAPLLNTLTFVEASANVEAVSSDLGVSL
jgi:hypothetical protein